MLLGFVLGNDAVLVLLLSTVRSVVPADVFARIVQQKAVVTEIRICSTVARCGRLAARLLLYRRNRGAVRSVGWITLLFSFVLSDGHR